MLHVLVDISLKVLLQKNKKKRHQAMQKFIKMIREKKEKMDTKMSEVFKTMGT